MLHTIEQESMFRYLLGELSEEEQREIEERYFSDTEYFEGLLRLEENLIDEFAQTKGLTGKHEQRDSDLVAKIEELPETRFAKEWIDIVEMKVQAGGEKRATSAANPRPPFQQPRDPVVGVAAFYEAEIRQAKSAIRREEVEGLLSEAWANRELASALMDSSWLGLKILMILRSKPLTGASRLAAAADVQIDLVASILVRLVRFEAISQDKNLFALTERGAAVIKNLEHGMTGTP